MEFQVRNYLKMIIIILQQVQLVCIPQKMGESIRRKNKAIYWIQLKDHGSLCSSVVKLCIFGFVGQQQFLYLNMGYLRIILQY